MAKWHLSDKIAHTYYGDKNSTLNYSTLMLKCIIMKLDVAYELISAINTTQKFGKIHNAMYNN